jgi:hypothetical protein
MTDDSLSNDYSIQEVKKVIVQEIKAKVEQNRIAIIQFMLNIVAIPSMDSQLKECG